MPARATYDCADLHAELQRAQQSLASGTELLLQARSEKDQAEHELHEPLLNFGCFAFDASLWRTPLTRET
jgi:hypothetical protein